MSEQTGNFPLVDTHRDGAIFAKVWRNYSREGEAFYSVTLGRTYTDPETGQPRESASFQGTDILKAQTLLGEAYQTVNRERALDRQHQRQAEAAPRPQESAASEGANMRAQRDRAVGNARSSAGIRRSRARSRSAPEQ